MGDEGLDSDDEASTHAGGDEQNDRSHKSFPETVSRQCALLPNTSIFRLHGSLPLHTRLSSLQGFSSAKEHPTSFSTSSILLCTSVASRGLDLPLVRAVVQYDLPTESGATEYVHRVGRTARVGKGGEAWSFVAPSEVEWVKWVTDKMQGGSSSKDGTKSVSLEAVSVDLVLKKGFGGKGSEYEDRATEVQLSFERWILSENQVRFLAGSCLTLLTSLQNADLARKAFLSHIRAYATHPSDEKHIFHIRHLHLGHLAKAFALRETPSTMKSSGNATKSKKSRGKPERRAAKPEGEKGRAWEAEDEDDVRDAEKRMERVVREQGRLTKKGGKMISSGTSEFQITSGDALEKLVHQP